MDQLPPRLEDDVITYLRRRQEERLEPPDVVLVWAGLLILAWVLVLGTGKAVLQLCGLW
jgi:hypothetical protein